MSLFGVHLSVVATYARCVAQAVVAKLYFEYVCPALLFFGLMEEHRQRPWRVAALAGEKGARLLVALLINSDSSEVGGDVVLAEECDNKDKERANLGKGLVPVSARDIKRAITSFQPLNDTAGYAGIHNRVKLTLECNDGKVFERNLFHKSLSPALSQRVTMALARAVREAKFFRDVAPLLRKHVRLPGCIATDYAFGTDYFVLLNLCPGLQMDTSLWLTAADVNDSQILRAFGTLARFHAASWHDDLAACSSSPFGKFRWLDPVLGEGKMIATIVSLNARALFTNFGTAMPKSWTVQTLKVAASIMPAVQTYVAAADQPRVMTHNDFRIGNMLFEEDDESAPFIVDWAGAQLGHPMQDFMRLAYDCPTDYRRKNLRRLFEFYLSSLAKYGVHPANPGKLYDDAIAAFYVETFGWVLSAAALLDVKETSAVRNQWETFVSRAAIIVEELAPMNSQLASLGFAELVAGE